MNPDASKVAFSLGGNTHHVDGTFHVQSGSIDFDRTAQTISGSIVVAAGSGNSGDQGRDKKMNSDVLDVAHFAEISFVPKSFQGNIAPAGDSTIQVTGVFTLHGTPHDLTVPMQIHIEGSTLTAKDAFHGSLRSMGIERPEHLYPQSCQGRGYRPHAGGPSFLRERLLTIRQKWPVDSVQEPMGFLRVVQGNLQASTNKKVNLQIVICSLAGIFPSSF